VYGQDNFVKGTLIDKITHKPLAYANIGIINTKYGTISDSSGIFNLKISSISKKNCLVSFAFIGYNTLELPLSSLDSINNLIELSPSVNILPEVTIGLKKFIPDIIGRNSIGFGLMSSNFYSYYDKEQNDRLSREMGMKFNIKNECKIEEFSFNIASNEYKSVKFRLNIYSIKNKIPNELLINENIIFTVENQFLGWFKLDLKPYNIYIDKENKDIAVTIQWIESVKINEKSKYFAISSSLATKENNIFREKGFDKWAFYKANLSFYIKTLNEF